MSKLSNLFRWKQKVEIRNGEKVLATVWVRLVGDNEYQKARTEALRRSRAMRAKLRDTSSEENLANFSDIASLEKDELVLGICIADIPDYRDEAVLTIPDKQPEELGDNPTLEEQEDYQVIMDEYRQKRIANLAAFIDGKTNDRKAELEKEDLDELKKLYRGAIINMRCTEEFSRVFREYCIYGGTFEDKQCKNLAFSSFEDFNSSASMLKDQLLVAYTSLELSGDDLKN